MKKNIRHSLFLLLSAILFPLLCGCSSEKTPKELFEERQSGVCMVFNRYYYEIDLHDGMKYYCSGITDNGDCENFTDDDKEIMQKRGMASGTAFFVNKEGTLMTNRHVISPVIPEEVVRKTMINVIAYAKENIWNSYIQLETELRKITSLKEIYAAHFWVLTPEEYQEYLEISQQEREINDEFQKVKLCHQYLQTINMNSISVRSVNEIGIAYNNSFVNDVEAVVSQNPCEVIKVSDNPDVDLALIQLKGKQTPEDKYVFSMETDEGPRTIGEQISQWWHSMFSKKKDPTLQIGCELHMIGFNAGLDLGNTRLGLRAQLTSGNVSQNPDGNTILYSIPALPGSSGSPVIDSEGRVRAVNFAKYKGGDLFNFGIPEERIRKFLEK